MGSVPPPDGAGRLDRLFAPAGRPHTRGAEANAEVFPVLSRARRPDMPQEAPVRPPEDNWNPTPSPLVPAGAATTGRGGSDALEGRRGRAHRTGFHSPGGGSLPAPPAGVA